MADENVLITFSFKRVKSFFDAAQIILYNSGLQLIVHFLRTGQRPCMKIVLVNSFKAFICTSFSIMPMLFLKHFSVLVYFATMVLRVAFEKFFGRATTRAEQRRNVKYCNESAHNIYTNNDTYIGLHSQKQKSVLVVI